MPKKEKTVEEKKVSEINAEVALNAFIIDKDQELKDGKITQKEYEKSIKEEHDRLSTDEEPLLLHQGGKFKFRPIRATLTIAVVAAAGFGIKLLMGDDYI